MVTDVTSRIAIRSNRMPISSSVDPAGRGQGVGLAQDRIGAGNGEFGDQRGVDRVTEVDDAGDDPAPDQQVMVVGVIVDHPGPARRESRPDPVVPAIEEAFEQRPVGRVDHVMQPRPRAPGMAQVPVEVVVRARMAERQQRRVKSAKHPPQAVEQFGGADGTGEDLARQVADHPHEMAVDRAERRAVECRAQPGHRQVRGAPGQMGQHRPLEIERDRRLGRVGDLDHPAGTVGLGQPEILVALAVQTVQAADKAIETAGKLADLVGGEARRGLLGDRHRTDIPGHCGDG
jgi:hypothetical protein